MEEVSIADECLRIGTTLDHETCAKLIQLLRKNTDLFKKKLKDLGGINREMAEHKLEVMPGNMN